MSSRFSLPGYYPIDSLSQRLTSYFLNSSADIYFLMKLFRLMLAKTICRIIKSVDAAMQLSQAYELHITELGHAYVLFFFSTVVGLIDSTVDDWEYQNTTKDRPSGIPGSMDLQKMDVDLKGTQNDKRVERRDWMRRTNSLMALEVLEKISESKKGATLLRVIHLNMPEKFDGLLKRLCFHETCKMTSPNLIAAKQIFIKLSTNIQRSLAFEGQLSQRTVTEMLVDIESCNFVPCWNSKSALPACWVLFDIYMESTMDPKQLPITSAVDILTETVITLQVLNQASWQETFLALWVSGLRLVQRERDPPEGPIPHLEARLCVLLSIVPLAIANILKDDVIVNSSPPQDAKPLTEMELKYGHGVNGKIRTPKRDDLILALQSLGQFSSLLCPPESVLDAANRAAAKAADVISLSKNTNDSKGSDCPSGSSVKAGGNMRHLIVEACIARNLIDASAYFWPDYVSASVISLSDATPKEMSPWSVFMEGAPLTESLISSLIATPATSLAEIKKVSRIALNGSEEEKSAAAKILCGASLSCGWNIQEHVVNFVVKLLSPPLLPGHDESQNYLMDHMPMLSAVLFGVSPIETVHILSLHGAVPEFAAALMPLCEVFGSLNPALNNQSKTGDQLSVYRVFSAAFLVLLRLWKFYRPAIERGLKEGDGAIGVGLTLEYLLLLRNRRFPSATVNPSPQDKMPMDLDQFDSPSDKPIYIDFFPKLRAWYCQNKICVASPLSGLCTGNSVHQVANRIISTVYSKMTMGGPSSDNSAASSGTSCGSSSTGGEEPSERPLLPAWELLEAIPFALESLLTACAYGKLSSRHLTTGLRDLVDFFPASLAAIISYFSAEITRGVWKLVPMNGTDWPSPAQILPKVESDMKGILAAAGVNVPSYPSDGSTSMLPLPMAALVSLTITFKLDRNIEYLLAVAGPALENCATGCSWPSMPTISSLWAQKIQRWHKYIVYSCSRSVFRQSKGAVTQLLRSCFTSFLGIRNGPDSPLTSQGSINGLLGHISPQGGLPNSAPGLLFLRSCRLIQDVEQVNDVIVGLVAEFARDSVDLSAKTTSTRLRSAHSSLSITAARAKEVSSLGASLLCAAGGPRLVYELYRRTIPTWLLSAEEVKLKEVSSASRIIEGYAMAYLMLQCGACTWGIKDRPLSWGFSSQATRVVAAHMDFLAGVLEGNVLLGCHPVTWKTYVSCLLGFIVNFNPVWVREVRKETLRKLACGLRKWHKSELALSLLERAGIQAMDLVAESLSSIG
ncbi:mediator of RNA polymerase II transcription subunit 33A-like isoform X2 [Punica granatum]|uniref:Mediator of RNA polymerase II transcription subunit 33A-like isoform X2 n=1 Tax=Punica granatum TaxID=22663 RepID=A0A6P8CUB0_PUNGR|nr:mediator of RNA polymerase II transcription subunit 33A-like isoform X2 [Punica granatum]